MANSMCSNCNKFPSVIFVTKIQNGISSNEGICLVCARELNIKPVQDIINKMGLSDKDIDELAIEMKELMEYDEDNGKTKKAVDFPILNRLFGESSTQKTYTNQILTQLFGGGVTHNNVKTVIPETTKDIVKALISNTEVLKEQFDSFGLEVSSFGYNINDSYWITAFIEVKSSSSDKLDGNCEVGITLYDENENILNSDTSNIYKSKFSGYQMIKLHFQVNGLALDTRKAKIFIYQG